MYMLLLHRALCGFVSLIVFLSTALADHETDALSEEPKPTLITAKKIYPMQVGRNYIAVPGRKSGENILYEDVILGSSKDVKPLQHIAELKSKNQIAGFGISRAGGQRLWPAGIIAVEISGNLDLPTKALVYKAMLTWNENTNVHFITADQIEKLSENGHPELMLLLKKPVEVKVSHSFSTECAATIGKNLEEPNVVVLDERCDYTTILHELGHTIGLHHEHMRPDRDHYIQVHKENIRLLTGWDEQTINENFDPQPDFGVMVGDYDTQSIMHYPEQLPGVDLPLFSKVKEDIASIGGRGKLSEGDIETVNTLYPRKPLWVGLNFDEITIDLSKKLSDLELRIAEKPGREVRPLKAIGTLKD